jgi:hypothetical protein
LKQGDGKSRLYPDASDSYTCGEETLVPDGIRKSGAFILPALFLSSAPYNVFYGSIGDPSKESKKRMEEERFLQRLTRMEKSCLLLALRSN